MRLINAPLNAASRTIAQSLSDSKSGGPYRPYQLKPDLRYYRPASALFIPQRYTITPCLSLSAPVPLERSIADKSAILSPRVPPCRPLSVKKNDYEQRRSQVRALPSAPSKVA